MEAAQPDYVKQPTVKNNNVMVKCPHCGKEGNKPILKRWHFDNCKSNPNYIPNASKKPKPQQPRQAIIETDECISVDDIEDLEFHIDQVLLDEKSNPELMAEINSVVTKFYMHRPVTDREVIIGRIVFRYFRDEDRPFMFRKSKGHND